MGLVSILLSLMGMAWAQGVVLLETERTADGMRFHTELALTLEDVAVRPAPGDFTSQPMASQLDQVRPMLEDAPGSAVVWLDGSDADRLWVSVAFVESERAVIRMIDLPRGDGAIPQLALAVRELVSSIYANEAPPPPAPQPEAPPPPTDPPPVVWLTGNVGMAWPPAPLAGGPRGALMGAVERQWDRFGLAGEIHAQVGRAERRLGPAMAARWRGLTTGIQLDWMFLEWPGTRLQPQLFVGGTHRWKSGATVGTRLSVATVRDQVFRGEQKLYDSGWLGFSVFLGWGRKISGS